MQRLSIETLDRYTNDSVKRETRKGSWVRYGKGVLSESPGYLESIGTGIH